MDRFDVEDLTATLAALGRATGEFDQNEAMLLAGRTVVVLSYRRLLHAAPTLHFSHVVHQVLAAADHPLSARSYTSRNLSGSAPSLVAGPGDEVPIVIHRDGRPERFAPELLASSLLRASQLTGEIDETTALVIAGTIAKVLGLRRVPSRPLSTAELEELVENVLIDAGHLETAHTIYGSRHTKECSHSLEDAVSSFLSSLEKAA